ncbi:LysR substrate-binding domain-containing protein [Curvivirga aplysinae]|uniref:LysR substrate-binding domain-containing protein n=1 Tax=Curvivirga aplysinae TaxID=2529852 RepID=UPI0012BD0E97|nr:LysR substrate-binding domain-containing protein [Curvivirga aplysinae]MTI09973.1 LysR family transcriptional regulator [Curvivirga aplysinae]
MVTTRKYHLPPMELLVCFEAVARHNSFTIAAEELCLTQSAVSKKISALETFLSTKLFKRMHRSIQLTEDGQVVLNHVDESLTQLNEGLKTYFPSSGQMRITVSASVSFSYFWLIPKIEKFYALHPDIEVNVISSDTPVDFKKDGSDIAILFGEGAWPELTYEKLVDEVVYVVASPTYLEKFESIQLDDLSNHILVHLKDGVQIFGGVNWDKWMKKFQPSKMPQRQGPTFNSYPLVLQAVEAGRGLGLGWDYSVEEKIAAGQLCKVSDQSVETSMGYYLVSSIDTELNWPVQQFKKWIISEAQN